MKPDERQRRHTRSMGCVAAALLGWLVAPLSPAQGQASWTRPIAPFRIAGNLFYVGSEDLAAYLVVTPAGEILINSNLEQSVPQIRRSVEQLGFRFADVKILLISHAHVDHAAGSRAVLQQTGATYMVMDGDVPVVESGGRAILLTGGRLATRQPPWAGCCTTGTP